MNSVSCKAALAAVILFAFAEGASAEVKWLPGNGQWCAKVCHDARRQPVSSGRHTADKKSEEYFFLCSADMNGWRPGYNLRPSWDDVCMVGYGGKEVRATRYNCACE
jgi:hypothetical protein